MGIHVGVRLPAAVVRARLLARLLLILCPVVSTLRLMHRSGLRTNRLRDRPGEMLAR
jgi:hypothetical protein